MSSDQLFSLPFEEQVGQFFFIGLPGTEVDAEARELIEEIKPGGIILFGRNVETAEQVRKLLDDCRALVLAMIAAWLSDADDRFPGGRQAARELLAALRAGPPYPALGTISGLR